jgi:predicted nuclease of predicted toxin-antitoxin system
VRFLVDNALSPLAAAGLRAVGHDATHVRDYALAAAEDDAILARAADEERILISADTDFGLLLALSRAARPSVILLRGSSQRRPEVQVALLLANLPAVQTELESGAIVVVEDDRVRIRLLPIGGA